jgi:hypothetical protein
MKRPNFFRGKTLWGLLILAVLLVVVRLSFLDVPMITDEGGCAYVATFWSSDHQLYRDINYDRFQGLFLVYKCILKIFGPEIRSIRLAASLYSIGTLLAIFFFARRLVGQSAGWIAGCFFVVFGAAPGIEGFTANSEMFAILPLTLSAYFSWRRRWFWAGFLAGAAVLFKLIGISGLLLSLLWILINRERGRAFLVNLLGFGICPGLAVIHGSLIGWKYFWATFFQRRAMAFSMISSGLSYQIGHFLESLQRTFPVWIALAILSVFAIAHKKSSFRWFGLFWIGTSLLGMAMGGNWFQHYYVQMIPPLAVMGGIGVLCLKEVKADSRAVWGGLALIGIAIFLVFQAKYWFMNPRLISLEMYHRPAYLVSQDVGDYIKNNTKKDDRIYVAFGQADIYYHARRKAAVPQQLFWHQIASNRDLWDRVVKSIQSKEPAMIVWVQYQPPRSFATPDSFKAMLEKGYALDLQLPFLQVYRRK